MNSVIWQLAQEALRNGGSPGGMSKWTRRAACGKKALQAEADREAWDGGIVAFAKEPSTRLNHLVVGTFYHLLHENAHLMPADCVWDATASAWVPEMQEAFRLYKAYRSQFGSVEERWGLKDLRFEVPLEAPRGYFEGQLVTGRMDAFGYMEHGPCGPGHYIVDLKTAGESSRARYAETPQAKAYLALAKLQFSNLDVRGMIFDEVRKSATPEFRTYEVRPSADFLPEVQALVRHGARNIAVPPGRCNTEAERRIYGGCRCKAEELREDGFAVAPDPLQAFLT